MSFRCSVILKGYSYVGVCFFRVDLEEVLLDAIDCEYPTKTGEKHHSICEPFVQNSLCNKGLLYR